MALLEARRHRPRPRAARLSHPGCTCLSRALISLQRLTQSSKKTIGDPANPGSPRRWWRRRRSARPWYIYVGLGGLDRPAVDGEEALHRHEGAALVAVGQRVISPSRRGRCGAGARPAPGSFRELRRRSGSNRRSRGNRPQAPLAARAYWASRRRVSACFFMAPRRSRRCSSGVPGRPDLSFGSFDGFAGCVAEERGFIARTLLQGHRPRPIDGNRRAFAPPLSESEWRNRTAVRCGSGTGGERGYVNELAAELLVPDLHRGAGGDVAGDPGDRAVVDADATVRAGRTEGV